MTEGIDTPVVETPVVDAVVDFVNPNGTFKEGWRSHMGEGMEKDETLGRFANVQNLAKTVVSQQRQIGLDKIAIPNEQSSPEEWSEVFTKLGRPETADSYTFEAPKELPEGFQIDESYVKTARDAAFELGINDKQFAGLVNFVVNKDVGVFKKDAEQAKHDKAEATSQLETDWGLKFTRNMDLANEYIRKFTPPDVDGEVSPDRQALLDLVGNSPVFARHAAMVAEKITESSGIDVRSTLNTPEEAQSKIEELMARPEYADAGHANHKNIVAQVTRLFQEKYPDKKPGNP